MQYQYTNFEDVTVNVSMTINEIQRLIKILEPLSKDAGSNDSWFVRARRIELIQTIERAADVITTDNQNLIDRIKEFRK